MHNTCLVYHAVQIYGDGKLIGGLDIMKELKEEGELASSLPSAAMVQGLS